MNNFDFHNKTEIYFGKDAHKRTGEMTGSHGSKVLFHYGGGSIKHTGLYDDLAGQLQKAGVDFVELGGVQPNPRLSLVEEGIALCREEGIDFILAVGGGSVIDSAKAIAAGVKYDGEVWDLFLGKAPVEDALPIGVVLTLPAAGSESSGGSVVTNEEGWFKRDIGSMVLRPRFAMLNPELTFTLPAYQTGCGASDMLAHVMERYFTNTQHVDLTDRLCEGIMKSIIGQAPRLMAHPDDYDARAEIMWAGTIAHNDLLGTGREQDWSSHKIEHELSGIYDIAHGAGLAIVFPAWMRHVYKENPEKLHQFFTRVFGIEHDFHDPALTFERGIKALEDFYRSIGMPVRLSEAGIDGSRIEEMAEKATDGGSFAIGGYRKLEKDDIKAILELAL